VDESGTEAAAVTITGIMTSAAPTFNKVLNANKPFIYFIKENTTNTILFAGILEYPVL
jgi:serpin B